MITKPRLLVELIHFTTHRKWYRSRNFSTVVDIGGCIGSFSYATHILMPKAQIFCFEPIVENYIKLKNNMSGVSNFKAFNIALGNKQGAEDFFINVFSPASSVLQMEELHIKNYPHANESEKTTVKIDRLDNILLDKKLIHPVLLKIDVQGYEKAVLEGAKETLKYIDVIIVEVSYQLLYRGQSTFDWIFSFLKENNFEFKGSFDTMFSSIDGSILQSDALFVRKKD